ncbi:MAG: triose-phosphate isomerase [Armatimonadetes bacterium]|nr:triose-phosphate isomerase [Armatimonadota bacterium]
MRRPIIAGNWKMNKTAAEARVLIQQIAPAAATRPDVDVVVCPPFTALHAAAYPDVARAAVQLGAQDMFWKDTGAYTGEVAPGMLLKLGCRYVIIGHSERRGRFGVLEPDFTPEVLSVFGETDATVQLKTHAAFRHGLTPIVCCGETLGERRAGRTDAVVTQQLEHGLEGVSADQARNLVIAYEPVWAIGTGEVCDPEEANRVCGVIRGALGRQFGDVAASIRIQYGGSVKATNAAAILSREEIDGALVGGASLVAEEFNQIVAAAPRR